MPDGAPPSTPKLQATSSGWGRPEGCDDFLPYGRQTIEDDDVAAVVAALRADLLTTGPLVGAFEAALAESVGARHAVACSNGTAALHIAVKAAGLERGDVAIVPSLTFLATADAPRFEGADVVFADVDPLTGLMTPEGLDEALHRAAGRRVRAILPVHLRGDAPDLPAIRALAEVAGAVVIEDACHAIGGVTAWDRVGGCAQSALACFSFHAVKTLCMAEGGAVTTNDPVLAERLRRARNHGATRDPARFALVDEAFTDGEPNPWWYEQTELGWNYRLPDVNCALGLSQLKKLPRFAARRRTLAARYREVLAPVAPLVQTMAPPQGSNPVPHLFGVRIDFEACGVSRKAVMECLRARGIGTQVHYIPVHWQPYWRDQLGELSLPGADAYYRSTLSLPLYPAMDDADPDRVADALAEALKA
jgi:UDP-4-amino-4,6-dideoxy-N-acetyl-beta-L-altrosamine transaminase